MPLLFGIDDACESAEELVARFLDHEVLSCRAAKRLRTIVGLAFAHQAGVDVDAAHAIRAERAQAKREGDGRIDAAADEEEDVAVADHFADSLLDQRHAVPRDPSPLSQPQTSKRKFVRICRPLRVWTTSGWNCTP